MKETEPVLERARLDSDDGCSSCTIYSNYGYREAVCGLPFPVPYRPLLVLQQL